MSRIPMTAREQLQRGLELGHELAVMKRGPWPEHGDPHPKWYVTCSCGWRGKAVRVEKSASATAIWHLSKAIAEGDDRAAAERRSRGASSTRSTRDQVTEGNGDQVTPSRPPTSSASSRRVG